MRWICISSSNPAFRYSLMSLPAPDADVLVAGGSTGHLECGLDPIRHEGVGRPALHGQRLSAFVSHDEHRHPERRRIPHGSNPTSNIRFPIRTAPVDA